MSTRRWWIAAGTTAVLAGGVGTYTYLDGDWPSSTPPRPVTGLRDTIQHVSAQTTEATRPHLVKTCTTGTRRVSHSSTTGTGSHRTTRTWYTTERYRDCRSVRHGTETYTRVLHPERWCVRLDAVDGDPADNDVWYRVGRGDYYLALAADYHARMKVTPLDSAPGC
ncbi:hypothetical protein ACWCV9_19865 [Streptomyces sp. NPDC001606]